MKEIKEVKEWKVCRIASRGRARDGEVRRRIWQVSTGLTCSETSDICVVGTHRRNGLDNKHQTARRRAHLCKGEGEGEEGGGGGRGTGRASATSDVHLLILAPKSWERDVAPW